MNHPIAARSTSLLVVCLSCLVLPSMPGADCSADCLDIDDLVGVWSWSHTSGGIGGHQHWQGDGRRLVLESDGTATALRGVDPIIGSFTVDCDGRRTKVDFSDAELLPLSDEFPFGMTGFWASRGSSPWGDVLMLHMRCFDCYTHYMVYAGPAAVDETCTWGRLKAMLSAIQSGASRWVLPYPGSHPWSEPRRTDPTRP